MNMTKTQIYSAMIELAAELVRGDYMPSDYAEDHKWCLSDPKRERRRIITENATARGWQTERGILTQTIG